MGINTQTAKITLPGLWHALSFQIISTSFQAGQNPYHQLSRNSPASPLVLSCSIFRAPMGSPAPHTGASLLFREEAPRLHLCHCSPCLPAPQRCSGGLHGATLKATAKVNAGLICRWGNQSAVTPWSQPVIGLGTFSIESQ